MSEHTASVGVDTLLAIDVPDDVFGFEMLALIEAVDFDFERWCRVIGLDPDDETSLALYDRAFYAYPVVWTRMGERDFAKAMEEPVAKWRRLVD